MRTLNIFEKLEALSRPLIKSYATDLEIDREMIEAHGNTPFVHWTRTTGTYMVHLVPPNHAGFPSPGEKVPFLFGKGDREKILDGAIGIAQHCTEGGHLLAVYFDGQYIKPISMDRSLAIVEEWAKKVKKSWADLNPQPPVGCTKMCYSL